MTRERSNCRGSGQAAEAGPIRPWSSGGTPHLAGRPLFRGAVKGPLGPGAAFSRLHEARLASPEIFSRHESKSRCAFPSTSLYDRTPLPWLERVTWSGTRRATHLVSRCARAMVSAAAEERGIIRCSFGPSSSCSSIGSTRTAPAAAASSRGFAPLWHGWLSGCRTRRILEHDRECAFGSSWQEAAAGLGRQRCRECPRGSG